MKKTKKQDDRIVWVLRIAEETLKKILNPITWEIYFPIPFIFPSERVLLFSPSLYFRFNWFVYFGSECA